VAKNTFLSATNGTQKAKSGTADIYDPSKIKKAQRTS
jgi:hypothetical protein